MPVATGAVKHRGCMGDGTPRGTASHGGQHPTGTWLSFTLQPLKIQLWQQPQTLTYRCSLPVYFVFTTVFESEFLTQT